MFKDYQWVSFYEEPTQESAIYVGHLTINSIDAIKRLDYPIIIPLRHPYLVQESWVRRGKPLSELIENFKLLINELDPLNPLYLPIDVENRQDYLDEINKKLDLDLRTNWSIVNSKKHTYNISYKDIDPAPSIRRFVEGNLNRFYSS